MVLIIGTVNSEIPEVVEYKKSRYVETWGALEDEKITGLHKIGEVEGIEVYSLENRIFRPPNKIYLKIE